MLSIPRFPESTRSLGWFARLAEPLLSEAKQVSLYNRVPVFNRYILSRVFSV